MAYIADIILILIFAVAIIISAYKGFFRSLIDLAGSLLAIIASKILSQSFAKPVYDSLVADTVENALVNKLGQGATVDYVEQLEGILSSLPEGINGVLQMMGIDKQVLLDKISSANLNGENLIESLMNSVVEPVAMTVIQLVLFVILAIVLIIAIKIVALLLDKIIDKLPIIKSFNKTLGALFGIIRGVIDVVIVSLLVSVVAGFIKNPEFVSVVESSVIINTVRDLFSSLLGFTI